MLPRKTFENLPAAMAIVVLFVKFSRKFCLKFLTLILIASPNMMHFVRIFSINRAYGQWYKVTECFYLSRLLE